MYKLQIDETGSTEPCDHLAESVLGLKVKTLTLLARTLADGLYEFIEETHKLSEQLPAVCGDGFDYYERVQKYEVELIRHALALTKGHQTKAAQLLKINPTTLNMKIKKYRIGFGGAVPAPKDETLTLPRR